MHYEELIQDNAPVWPYPVNYGKENEVSCDVLVLGGGIAGCWAAIGAARKGVRVVLVDKGAVKTSGAGGSGVDHWHAACTNPACTVSPEEFSQANLEDTGGWRSGIVQYITARESYGCLLELEQMGVKVRDTDDEFKGAEFRDEKSKLLFAYDYNGRYCVRVWGANTKPSLYQECRRLGVQIYDHVMITSLLNQGGKQGAAVVGATGVNVRTGEFYTFNGKATILCMFLCQRQYIFGTELKGLYTTHRPPNSSGDGHSLAWKAGALIAGAEQTRPGGGGPFGYPQYGVGNANNTWYACTMVDATGKEIPWVDRDGKILKTVSERYHPATGQKFFLSDMGRTYPYKGPMLMPDWRERARKGEFSLPIYSDLASMPELERKVIWGLMVAHEARTMIPIYYTYNQAGFNPDTDLLQSYDGGWGGVGPPQWRDATGGGVVVDWDLKTSLDRLYAAGAQIVGAGDHAYAASTGRYAGRKAADFAAGAQSLSVDRKQVDIEKTRVYAPVQRKNGIHWKELNAGVCKVMQDYCPEYKNEELLRIGLKWFDEIETGEAANSYARNPHELGRLLEVFNIMTNGRLIMESCRARKASDMQLGFRRTDYIEVDTADWRKWITVKLDGGEVKVGTLALYYHGDMKTSYEAHCGLESGA
jgi:succinate dehydrogenase/fumarate reductase flavoprotein subunit